MSEALRIVTYEETGFAKKPPARAADLNEWKDADSNRLMDLLDDIEGLKYEIQERMQRVEAVKQAKTILLEDAARTEALNRKLAELSRVMGGASAEPGLERPILERSIPERPISEPSVSEHPFIELSKAELSKAELPQIVEPEVQREFTGDIVLVPQEHSETTSQELMDDPVLPSRWLDVADFYPEQLPAPGRWEAEAAPPTAAEEESGAGLAVLQPWRRLEELPPADPVVVLEESEVPMISVSPFETQPGGAQSPMEQIEQMEQMEQMDLAEVTGLTGLTELMDRLNEAQQRWKQSEQAVQDARKLFEQSTFELVQVRSKEESATTELLSARQELTTAYQFAAVAAQRRLEAAESSDKVIRWAIVSTALCWAVIVWIAWFTLRAWVPLWAPAVASAAILISLMIATRRSPIES